MVYRKTIVLVFFALKNIVFGEFKIYSQLFIVKKVQIKNSALSLPRGGGEKEEALDR